MEPTNRSDNATLFPPLWQKLEKEIEKPNALRGRIAIIEQIDNWGLQSLPITKAFIQKLISQAPKDDRIHFNATYRNILTIIEHTIGQVTHDACQSICNVPLPNQIKTDLYSIALFYKKFNSVLWKQQSRIQDDLYKAAICLNDGELMTLLLDGNSFPLGPNTKLNYWLLAAEKGAINVIDAFLEMGFDINAKGYKGLTALALACSKHENMPLAQFLISKGANVDFSYKRGVTLLIAACYEKNEELISLLIEHKCNLNTSLPDGMTPLFIALSQRNIPLLQQLVEAGADVNLSLVDLKGNNISPFIAALYLAVQKNDNAAEEIALYLLDNGADLSILPSKCLSILDVKPLYTKERLANAIVDKLSKEELDAQNKIAPIVWCALYYGNSAIADKLIQRGMPYDNWEKRYYSNLLDKCPRPLLDTYYKVVKNYLKNALPAPFTPLVEESSTYSELEKKMSDALDLIILQEDPLQVIEILRSHPLHQALQEKLPPEIYQKHLLLHRKKELMKSFPAVKK
jgi:ankyrin repeat protein